MYILTDEEFNLVIARDLAIRLDEIQDPIVDNTITMSNKTLTWRFTNPSGGIFYEWIGNAQGHLFELQQNTGVPSAGTHLLHVEWSHPNITGIHLEASSTTDNSQMFNVTGDSVSRHSVLADGTHQWGSGTGAVDTNLYRSAANTLKTDDNFEAANLNIANWDTAYGWGDHASAGYITSSDFTTDGGFLVGTGIGTYQEETGNTARTSLGLGTEDNPVFKSVSSKNFNISDTTLDTTSSIIPIQSIVFKTGGITDASDNWYGAYLWQWFSQSGGVLGNFYSFYNNTINDAQVTNLISHRGELSLSSTGSVTNDVVGSDQVLSIQAGSSVTGDIVGFRSSITSNSNPGGNVIGLLLEEAGAYIDYGIYQNGPAPNHLGGNLSVGAGTGELTTGSINRASGTLTLEIGGTPEVSITSTETTFGGNIVIPNSGYIGSASDTDAMQIESDGDVAFSQKVGIGVTPTYPLHVSGSVWVDSGSLFINSSAPGFYGKVSDVYKSYFGYDPTGYVQIYNFQSTEYFRLLDSGGALVSGILSLPQVYSHDMNGETIRDLQINSSGELGYDSSTLRAKNPITKEIDSSWLHDVEIWQYHPKKNTEITRVGVMAEQLQSVMPEEYKGVVINEVYIKNGKIGYGAGSVNYSQLVPFLINEIKEIRNDLNNLKTSIRS